MISNFISFGLTKNIILFIKVITPAFLCVTLISVFEQVEYFKYNSIYFIISSFGVIIILLNLKKTRNNIFLSFIYSIISCFVIFFSSTFIVGTIDYLINYILPTFALDNNTLNKKLQLISIAIVSPLMMFYLYKCLFEIETNSFFKKVIIISIIVLVILGLTDILFMDEYLYISWQFVMAIALQLILYQKEIQSLLHFNKY